MFTGIVEQKGAVVGRERDKLFIRPEKPFANLVRGESIAVNGCCLTLEKESPQGVMEFHTLDESLSRTNLGEVSEVNLERALRIGDRLGGHWISGHIDTAAEILQFQQLDSGDWVLKVALSREFAPLVIMKGSIAVDGISLTVAELGSDFVALRLIPVTLEETALASRVRAGEKVNLEFDLIGKYILRKLECRGDANNSLTLEKLRENGFI